MLYVECVFSFSESTSIELFFFHHPIHQTIPEGELNFENVYKIEHKDLDLKRPDKK